MRQGDIFQRDLDKVKEQVVQMSGEKVFQEGGTASAKVLGQRRMGEFETARREHGWCERGEGRVRGEDREGAVRAKTPGSR